MRVTRLLTYPVRLPLPSPITWASTVQAAVDYVYLALHTDEGLVGLGEAMCLPAWYGESVQTLVAALDDLFAPLVVGADPLARRELRLRLDRVKGRPVAKALLETAIVELNARACGLPCWRWLGGTGQPVPLAYVISRCDTSPMVAEAEEQVGRFDRAALKVKVGRDVGQDGARLQAIRQACGPGVVLVADANNGYSRADAIRASRAFAPAGLRFFEDPCRMASPEDFRRVEPALEVPPLLDIPCGDARTCIQFMTAGAPAVSLKLCRLTWQGGFAAAEAARTLGTATHLGYTGEGELGSLIGAHFSDGFASSRHVPLECLFLQQSQQLELITPPVRFEGGAICLEDRPGFGVELNEAALKRFAF